jgi:hypothetical protein
MEKQPAVKWRATPSIKIKNGASATNLRQILWHRPTAACTSSTPLARTFVDGPKGHLDFPTWINK